MDNIYILHGLHGFEVYGNEREVIKDTDEFLSIVTWIIHHIT